MKQKDINRFKDKFIELSESECWEWTASFRGANQYGAFKLNGKVESAHRVSFKIFRGNIPNNLLVCHSCDNRKCVNPNHLFLGTHYDNVKDAVNKGRIRVPNGVRFLPGNKPTNRKLSNVVVKGIKKELQLGRMKIKEIADFYMVSRNTINDIKRGRSYFNI